MRARAILWTFAVAAVQAQDGQQGSKSGWPCVAGRAIDPAYLNISESTGGQLFLFQKGEAAHSGVVMSAPYTHPATVLRLVGNLNGARDIEFPVDRGIESLLVLVSLQCRKEILVLRPSGSELTATNSAQSIDLAAGRILRVDQPEPGIWRVRLAGTGLFVLSVLAKTDIRLTGVGFSSEGAPSDAHPLLGVQQAIQLRLSGEVSHIGARLVDASGTRVAEVEAPEKTAEGVWRTSVALHAERFRVVVTGEDSAAWPFQRMYPVLFSARRPQ